MRSPVMFRPRLERFEDKCLLNASSMIRLLAEVSPRPGMPPAVLPLGHSVDHTASASPRVHELVKATYKVSTPTRSSPPQVPFGYIRVDGVRPVNGRSYTVYFFEIQNQTKTTFTPTNTHFSVNMSGTTNDVRFPSTAQMGGNPERTWVSPRWLVFYTVAGPSNNHAAPTYTAKYQKTDIGTVTNVAARLNVRFTTEAVFLRDLQGFVQTGPGSERQVLTQTS